MTRLQTIKAFHLARNGKSLTEIARATGLSKDRVRTFAKRQGLFLAVKRGRQVNLDDVFDDDGLEGE